MSGGERPASDPPFGPEELEVARALFARPVAFLIGAASIDSLPLADLPEVGFAGRSNVGKSSLINALVARRALARASTEPGRTREINFFTLAGQVRLVDLPGYGFAKASRRLTHKFQHLARAYLRRRPNLKRVYLLIDARQGLKAADEHAMDAFDQAAVSYQVVLTKSDKASAASLSDIWDATERAVIQRPAAFPRILATSARSGLGLPQLRAEIAAALA